MGMYINTAFKSAHVLKSWPCSTHTHGNVQSTYVLTFGTLALAVRFVVCGANPAPLPGQHLEDKRLHDEGYHNLKDNH